MIIGMKNMDSRVASRKNQRFSIQFSHNRTKIGDTMSVHAFRVGKHSPLDRNWIANEYEAKYRFSIIITSRVYHRASLPNYYIRMERDTSPR